MPNATLPIDAVLPEIIGAMATQPRLILQADPGAGKTTKVPLALLQSGLLKPGQKILMLEPRRVAARAAASFMAQSLDEEVGGTVGYRVRFESRTGANTRIEVLTQGLLTRRIQQDPELADVGVVIFDEFHERHLATDLGLAFALDVQASLRPDLKILLMSATIDAERIASFLDAPAIRSEGRSFPVEVRAFPAKRDEKLEHQVIRCVREAMAGDEGDVLVFLPGLAQIRRVERLLANDPMTVLTLHGEMTMDAQSHVLRAHGKEERRVVLATNVAESSVTLPNVRVVIDSGLANEPRFDAQTGLSSLKTVLISQASADQRSGRAGRTAPGVAYRLWPASQRLDSQRRAEIAQADLSGFALEMAAWGSDSLQFLDAPPRGTLLRARAQLRALGFFDAADKITAQGRRALDLGLDVRLAKVVLEAPNDVDIASILTALESGRQLRSDSDAWLRRHDEVMSRPSGPVKQLLQQWRRRLRSDGKRTPQRHEVAALLAPGFLEWVARQSAKDPYRYYLFNGNTAQLGNDSDVFGHEYLLITELTHDRPHARIRSAVPVDEDFLRQRFAAHWTERDEAIWNPASESVSSARVARFGQIEMDRRAIQHADKDAMANALLAYVRQEGLAVLPVADRTQAWLARARCAMAWDPKGTDEWPPLDETALLERADTWLLPALKGKSKISGIDPLQIDQAIRSQLDWNQTQHLNALCPMQILVPSGLERSIVYGFDEHWRDADGNLARHAHEPVLAVKLQELFGLAQTPCIGNGRIPLTLQLLSPGGKPLQVTRDLRSFWDRTYPEVKKEMKGRYPKHPWPDDPWSATATHRAKPRGT